MNQYLTIENNKGLYSRNRLKRIFHKPYPSSFNLKISSQHYKVRAHEMEKLLRITSLFSHKKIEKMNKQQGESHLPIPAAYDHSTNHNQLHQSIDHELTDIKKLLSFLVQQNEQSRLQQKKMKEQNEKLLKELNELRQTLHEIKQEQDAEYEREYHSFTTIYKSLLYIEEKVDNIAVKTEDKKLKANWQKLFEK